ncbi:MAG: hypothetical protein A2Y75_01720 [Candidatus Solincola sediminis]|uniref:dTDP-4-dehydrorhamnose 3,5-epimerase n=1 Tax=Candidatus Solincola sediminis TaxID=1797199 RepID=A0A1F2WQZ4_9ACTN|nr:MAG: hypothetical protein A2Y75_01720 [Candidatus Solincola sediminis]
MIEGLEVRELPSHLGEKGLLIELGRTAGLTSSCHSLFPEIVDAWTEHQGAIERVICLEGMIKLVTYDARPDSPTRGKVCELFLGEYRYREVKIPAGVLRGWKATGNRGAIVLSTFEGEDAQSRILNREEAGVPYDWDIVMK